ncbi:MAG: peptide-methionine (S)-S-oxide reductase [Cyclobacteriaceae bacterium]|jgi:peptide-methionine (S)-S-oxide reductase
MRQILSILFLSLTLTQCGMAGQKVTSEIEKINKPTNTELQELETAYFASGCFWCVEAVYESVRGVKEAVSGYSGGKEKNPTYRQVGSGQSGHAEAVVVYYDPKVVSFKTLVKVYYGSHNPTTVNGQAPDFGQQYRSVIFYQNEEEKMIAVAYKDSLDNSSQYDQPIATQIIPFEKFWEAEEYHQDYEKRNPYQPYVLGVSVPRLKRFQAKFPELLKEED